MSEQNKSQKSLKERMDASLGEENKTQYRTTTIGEVRPSQLLWSYGPGGLIDMPNLSVVTQGIDQWGLDYCSEINEARLLAAVRRVLGQQVESLRMPPIEEGKDRSFIGVPVKPFPRWLRCVKCGMLAEYDSGLFEIKPNKYRPENTRIVHKDCKGSNGDKPARDADAVPARFLLACKTGHLDDFPWRYYVHNGPTDCKGTLRFYERGASMQTENLLVGCDSCGKTRNMAQAFGETGTKNLPACRGRHPHLNRFDKNCDQQPKAVLLGATNGWFPITLSALAIPVDRNPLAQLVKDGWNNFESISSEAETAVVIKLLANNAILPGIEKYSAAEVWKVVQAIQNDELDDEVTQEEIKGPEWKVLTKPNPPTDWPHFKSETVSAPSGYETKIETVLLLERLREVNALIGFTRVEAPDEGASDKDGANRAPLGTGSPTWIPASEVHGEGIFIRFNEEAIAQWEVSKPVSALNEKLFNAHKGWRKARKLDADGNYPGIRFALLHTISHLLIRELALECGYNAASIKERIYSDVDGEDNQAGILIYTAAADSDGTLGGLVELGKPENLRRLLDQALTRAHICSSDPLCSEHDPEKDLSLHVAACHACTFVSETSCEKGNRYLDRSLLIPTLADYKGAAFFEGES
jgi:hypothetical protein